MNGIGVSPGISIGKAYLFKKTEISVSGIILENDEDKQIESEKFKKAISDSIAGIEAIKLNKSFPSDREEIEILETQIEFLSDPQIESDILDKINNEFKTAGDAVIEVIAAAAQMLRNIEDEYISARASDVQDIGNRILNHLNNNFSAMNLSGKDNIVIAEDISPSDTITFDITKIAGFATILGGKTSHTAIIAKAKGIPAVVGCGEGLAKIEENDTVIIDGSTGEVIIRPDQNTIKSYIEKQKIFAEVTALLKTLKNISPITTDGHKINLYANISSAVDLGQVFENGGEGVGLLRSELLFMGRTSFPNEEEQFQFYKQVAVNSGNNPVVVRTLDIGGDKHLPYFKIPPETNPFLGYRAIRICLDQKEIFITQLKAILRAGIFGKLKIMFPMICNADEVKQAKGCVQEAMEELTTSGIEFDRNTELGIMIEIPSAALMADILAKEVDFFSIGTNDLCQYTLAVDRMNNKISELYTHFNPGVLRLIYNVIEQAHKHKKHVGLCGEMASDPLATLLLLGMGLDEFSMGAASIPAIKNIIIRNSMSDALEVCRKVMKMENSDTITSYLKEVMR